jgi:molybdopterin-guanine dinucleotide biosynthesis protein A
MIEEKKKKNIAGAILAGGDASRLDGIAKGTIEVGGRVCIIECLIKEFFGAGINDLVIVANDARPYRNYGIKIIPDLRPGNGPIGGIEVALVHFEEKCDAVMFVPCDMPNITAKELLALKEAFVRTNNPVVFAQTAGFFWHPLCAVVHIGLKEMISSAIDDGQRAIRDIWQRINAKALRFSDTGAFMNINNFADMENWQKALK